MEKVEKVKQKKRPGARRTPSQAGMPASFALMSLMRDLQKS
jgi:hypothetical protein